MVLDIALGITASVAGLAAGLKQLIDSISATSDNRKSFLDVKNTLTGSCNDLEDLLTYKQREIDAAELRKSLSDTKQSLQSLLTDVTARCNKSHRLVDWWKSAERRRELENFASQIRGCYENLTTGSIVRTEVRVLEHQMQTQEMFETLRNDIRGLNTRSQMMQQEGMETPRRLVAQSTGHEYPVSGQPQASHGYGSAMLNQHTLNNQLPTGQGHTYDQQFAAPHPIRHPPLTGHTSVYGQPMAQPPTAQGPAYGQQSAAPSSFHPQPWTNPAPQYGQPIPYGPLERGQPMASPSATYSLPMSPPLQNGEPNMVDPTPGYGDYIVRPPAGYVPLATAPPPEHGQRGAFPEFGLSMARPPSAFSQPTASSPAGYGNHPMAPFPGYGQPAFNQRPMHQFSSAA